MRSAAEVRAMAIAVQANLVQLRTAALRLDEAAGGLADVNAPPPGAVKNFRETLIDREIVRAMDRSALATALQEQWGRYCLMRWMFHESTPEGLRDLSRLTPASEMRCETELRVKEAELHAMLWRYRHDERARLAASYRADAAFARYQELADFIPPLAAADGLAATPDARLALACQYAGMLATLRWVIRPQTDWQSPDLAAIADEPFTEG